jgi:hypothetical protein
VAKIEEQLAGELQSFRNEMKEYTSEQSTRGEGH